LSRLIIIQDQVEKENLSIPITVGKKVFEIPLEKLFLKKKQTYRIKQAGLTKANEEDIYDVNNKSDIIFHVEFI